MSSATGIVSDEAWWLISDDYDDVKDGGVSGSVNDDDDSADSVAESDVSCGDGSIAVVSSSDGTAVPVVSAEKRCISFIADAIQLVLLDVLKAPPFLVDAIVRILRLIGTDADMNMLYDTVTCVKSWHLAITPYAAPFKEYAALFSTYKIHCPLDRMVYAVLASQSLTLIYNTYKTWVTSQRLHDFTYYVKYLEGLRSSIRARARSKTTSANDFSRRALRYVVRYFADNTHVVLHDTVVAIVRRLDERSLETHARAYLAIANDFVSRLVSVLRDTRQVIERTADVATMPPQAQQQNTTIPVGGTVDGAPPMVTPSTAIRRVRKRRRVDRPM